MWSFVILFGKTFFEIPGEQAFVFAYGVDVVGGDSYFFFFAFDTVVDFLHHTVINATESTAIDTFCDFVGLFYLFDVLQIKL